MVVRERVDPRGKLAVERAHSGARGLRGARLDEIGDGLGLREIHLVVQERAQRELAGLGRTRAEREHAFEQQAEHDRSAVRVQLQHVLTSKGMRRGKVQRKPAIDARAVGAAIVREPRVSRRRQRTEKRGADRGDVGA